MEWLPLWFTGLMPAMCILMGVLSFLFLCQYYFTGIFIRKKSEPDKPFYTLEYNPKTENIVQCRGSHNCGKTPEVEAFVNAWSEYIRNKKKKSHAAA